MKKEDELKTMKISLMKRIICGILVLIMLGGALLGALSMGVSATTILKKTGISVTSQPRITFYDINGEKIGTFSHAANSSLVGFTSSQVIYYDKEGESVEKTYSRADVEMHFVDKSIKFDNLTKSRRNSYYFKYEMGSSKGGVLSNNMDFSEDDDGFVAFDITVNNVVFRDANKMKWTINYQTTTTNKVSDKSILKTNTISSTFTFTKAKLESLIGKETTPKKKTDSTTTDATTGADVKDDTTSENVSYGDATTDPPTTDPPTDKPNTDTTTKPDTTPNTNAGIETPYLILDSFTAQDSGPVAAGSSFPLNFTCRNTSAQIDLENIIVKLTTAEGLQIADSTNTFYIPILPRSGTFEQSINLSALPNADAKSYPIDLAFSYEYVANDTRQKGEMTQQIAIPVVQKDRFTVDPVGELMEGTVGEEMDISGKYVNKSRGEIFNLSATLDGNFTGSGKIQHVGNVAAGISGDVEFTITPSEAGTLNGYIRYTYEDAMGNPKGISIPFQTTINEAQQNDMGMGMGMMEDMNNPMLDENGNPIDPNAKQPNFIDTFVQNVQNPNSWEMWSVVGGVVLIVIIIVATIIRKKKAAKEFEEDNEAI